MVTRNISEDVRERFSYWRSRVFYSIFFGYVFFYFTRKSFTFAMPMLASDLGFDKTSLGLLVTIFSISYGVSKFVSGIWGDRANPRYFMGIGLIITGILNICFGCSSSLLLFIIFWGLNGWFQGFGWPPCARLLSYWYSKKSRGTWWSIWSTSHNIGGALIPIIVAFSMDFAGWRYALFVPGVLCILFGFIIINRLRDTPESLGLPEAHEIDGAEPEERKEKRLKHLSVKEILAKYILYNPVIWYLSLANFFVYVVRTGINDWTMLYLSEVQGFSLVSAGATIPWFEIGGVLGMLIAGVISDKYFAGNRGTICLIFMVLLCGPVFMFWSYSSDSYLFVSLMMFFIGLFLFGPQMLIGCAAAEKSHPDAAATASGFAGTFGYLGAAVAGYPFGYILENFGWDGFFMGILLACGLGALCFWPICGPRIKQPLPRLAHQS